MPGPDYPRYNQFPGADGKPLYPQRPVLLGPMFTRRAAGSVPNGKWDGKMILGESLWDREAWPWQAVWYRNQVDKHLGAATDQHFRLWYTDHALHSDSIGQEDAIHTVGHLGMLHQALRDVAAWVEKGTAPPASTSFTGVDETKVVVPPATAARGGIQSVVTLEANGGRRADVAAGQSVRFTGTIEVPPGAGSVVAAQWDFDGSGAFALSSPVKPRLRRVTVTITHVFEQPGTYFAVLRGVSQRRGDAKAPYARIQNLDRVHVVVR